MIGYQRARRRETYGHTYNCQRLVRRNGNPTDILDRSVYITFSKSSSRTENQQLKPLCFRHQGARRHIRHKQYRPRCCRGGEFFCASARIGGMLLFRIAIAEIADAGRGDNQMTLLLSTLYWDKKMKIA